jgi:hypothetical protein
MTSHPTFYRSSGPDLSSREDSFWWWEVWVCPGELMDPLTGYAQHVSDLCDTHEVTTHTLMMFGGLTTVKHP